MFVSIDIVVVNYHTPKDLDDFIESLERFPVRADASLTIMEVDAEPYVHTFSWQGKPGKTVGVQGNIGYARACNHAASLGHRDVIAFFNADIVLTKGAIDLCHDALQGRPDWAVLGPCQVDNVGRIKHAGIFGTHASPVHRGWNEPNRRQYNDVRDAITVSGSAYFIRRTAWKELSDCPIYRDIAPDAEGAFLPTQHYYEETWASYHAHAHDLQVVYYGYVTIVHKWHGASQLGGWAEKQMPISRQMFRRACKLHGIAHD
jgi:GT2 family glycosyltransferase